MKMNVSRASLGRATRVLIFSLVLLALVMPAAHAAATRIWVKRYNGPANGVDSGAAVTVDKGGLVYVAGRSTDVGTGEDFLVIKYGLGGAVKWKRRYDAAGLWDGARGVAVDDNGNVYVTGRSFGNGSHGDFATIKYNANGGQQWVKRYTSAGYYDDGAMDIALDSNGNVIVTGFSTGWGSAFDFLTIKYAPNGTRLWVKRYDGPGNGGDQAQAVVVDPSDNIYVTGPSKGDGTNADYCTIKYSPSGAVLWVRRWNSSYNMADGATDIAVDPRGDVYVTGYSYRSQYNADYATVRYLADGTKKWVKRYDGTAKGPDVAWGVAYFWNRVCVTGSSLGRGSDTDYATVCYKVFSGAQQWVKRYDGPASDTDVANDITARNRRVYVTGFSTSGNDADYYTAAYGVFTGSFKWADRYDGPASGFDQGNAIAFDRATGKVYVTGGSFGTGTKSDFATVKYEQ
jgi:uncharacterized delta-60 repeat protein